VVSLLQTLGTTADNLPIVEEMRRGIITPSKTGTKSREMLHGAMEKYRAQTEGIGELHQQQGPVRRDGSIKIVVAEPANCMHTTTSAPHEGNTKL
jgi:hypothetical protein